MKFSDVLLIASIYLLQFITSQKSQKSDPKKKPIIRIHPPIPKDFNIFLVSRKGEIPTDYPIILASEPVNPSRMSMRSEIYRNPSTSGVIKSCGPYATRETFSATKNTVTCSFSAPPGVTILIADCATEGCATSSNDQEIILKSSTGTVLASNDDGCNSCSVIKYTTVGDSTQEYILHQGCYGMEACSGNFVVSIMANTIHCKSYKASDVSLY